MKLICFLSLFLCSMQVWGQQSASGTKTKEVTTKHEVSFDDYCKQNATTIIEIPTGKSNDFPVNGNVKMPSVAQPSYLDYGVKLLDQTTQYFSIEGTGKVLRVESLYRLQLQFALSQQKL